MDGTVRTGFYALPVELIIQIFCEVDAPTLLVCRRVCRLFNGIDDAYLQYKIELAFAGMEDGPPGHFDTIQRLEMLRARQRALNNIEWAAHGAFLHSTDTWQLSGNVMAQSYSSSEIIMVKQLPSKLKGLVVNEWKIKLDFSTPYFAIDSANDLVIAFGYSGPVRSHWNLHLLSLTTGEYHPQASVPILSCNSTWVSNDLETAEIRYSSSFIGVLIDDRRRHSITFYNWRTGQIAMELASQNRFSFVTDSIVIVAAADRNTFRAGLNIYDLNNSAKGRLCSFMFPHAKDLRNALDFDVKFGDDQSSTSHRTWDPSIKVPFYTSQEHTLLSIECSFSKPHRQPQQKFVLLLPVTTILAHALPVISGKDHADVHWNKWGLHGARIIHINDAPGSWPLWSQRTYGQEIVIPSEQRRSGFLTVNLYNCNTLSLNHAASSSEYNRDTTRILMEPTSIDTDEFAVPFHSYLPCMYRTVDIPIYSEALFNNIMLSEEALVAVSNNRNLYIHSLNQSL